MREGSLGNSPSNETSCLSFLKEVRQNRLFATLVVLMMGGTLQHRAADKVTPKGKKKPKIFLLLLITSCDPFQPTTMAPLRPQKKIHLSPFFMLNFIFHEYGDAHINRKM